MVTNGRKWGKMFGTYYRALDDKNRVMIPSKFRNKLGESFYVSLGPDNVLEIRNDVDFQSWSESLTRVSMLNKSARAFKRLMLGNTQEMTPDKQGRVVFPSEFLAKLNVTKEIAFVGVGDKIEIWAKESLEDFNKGFENQGSLDDLAAQLLKDGIEL